MHYRRLEGRNGNVIFPKEVILHILQSRWELLVCLIPSGVTIEEKQLGYGSGGERKGWILSTFRVSALTTFVVLKARYLSWEMVA